MSESACAHAHPKPSVAVPTSKQQQRALERIAEVARILTDHIQRAVDYADPGVDLTGILAAGVMADQIGAMAEHASGANVYGDAGYWFFGLPYNGRLAEATGAAA